MMRHEPRRLVERVSFVTSPGHGNGGGWRRAVGLRGGPRALVTTMGVFRFPSEGGPAELESLHPGVTPEEIVAATGWRLEVSGHLASTRAPSEAEMAALRRYDPQGFWTSD